MLWTETIFLLLVLLIRGKTYAQRGGNQCVNAKELQTTGGQKVWLLISNQTGIYPPLCEWELNPPENHLVFVNIFDLFLKTQSNTCSAELIINGERMCNVKGSMCKLYEVGKPSQLCQKTLKSGSYVSCTKHTVADSKVSINLKQNLHEVGNSRYQYIKLVYKYINCDLEAKSGGYGAGTAAPKRNATDATSTATVDHKAFNIMFTSVIPIGATLVIIIAVLLVIICKRRCKDRKANSAQDETPYEYAGQDGFTILADANSDYENISVRYEAIRDIAFDGQKPRTGDVINDDVSRMKMAAKSEKEIVENILYEKEIPTFISADNVTYDLTLNAVVKKN